MDTTTKEFQVLIGILREVDGFFQDPTANKEDFLEGTAAIVNAMVSYSQHKQLTDEVQSIIDWHYSEE